MASSSLTGRRGWSTVVSLTTVLGALVAFQLPAASAAVVPGAGALSLAGGARTITTQGLSAVAAGASLADRDGTRVSRRPAATSPLPAAAPASRAAVARPAVAQSTAPKPAAAKPAPPRPAAPRPAAAKPAAPGLCSGAGWQERRGQAALASLRGGAGKAGYRISFEPARKGLLGLTYLDERRIALFVRSCAAESTDLLRHVMAHELGHAHDTAFLGASDRTAWMSARGIATSTPWYGCDGCSDFATPAGDFAEVYAQWARGSSSNKSKLAGDVPPGQLAALAQRFFGA